MGTFSGGHTQRRPALTSRRTAVRAAATDEDVGPVGLAAVAGGFIANPVVLWSLYTLKTTGDDQNLNALFLLTSI
jgi:hypothetical protein